MVAKLPAVSGSSGRLVIEKTAETGPAPSWPGQVFAEPNRDYSEAMLAFVVASQQADEAANSSRDEANAQTLKAQKQALRQEEEQLRQERRKVRQRRQVEDAAWQTLKREHQAQAAPTVTTASAARAAHNSQWRHLRQQRRANLAQRTESDQIWKQQRLNLRQRWSQLPIVTAWIAILVITDNCTRQCLGLPLFVAGSSVTAEMIVEALRLLLPPELLFLISDRGIHFRADAFRTLMRQAEFIHVLIARHRPQSNGIAERFVRSLKEWLRHKSWQDDHELALLLDQFLAEYNDRPHQGLPIPGLSPNEFAKRIWLL